MKQLRSCYAQLPAFSRNVSAMAHFRLFAKDSTPTAEKPTYVVSVLVEDSLRDEDEVLLFPPSGSASEIDAQIDLFITQLNGVRHKAKEKIADALRE